MHLQEVKNTRFKQLLHLFTTSKGTTEFTFYYLGCP